MANNVFYALEYTTYLYLNVNVRWRLALCFGDVLAKKKKKFFVEENNKTDKLVFSTYVSFDEKKSGSSGRISTEFILFFSSFTSSCSLESFIIFPFCRLFLYSTKIVQFYPTTLNRCSAILWDLKQIFKVSLFCFVKSTHTVNDHLNSDLFASKHIYHFLNSSTPNPQKL